MSMSQLHEAAQIRADLEHLKDIRSNHLFYCRMMLNMRNRPDPDNTSLNVRIEESYNRLRLEIVNMNAGIAKLEAKLKAV